MKTKSLQIKFVIDGELIDLMRSTITTRDGAIKAICNEFSPYIELAYKSIFPITLIEWAKDPTLLPCLSEAILDDYLKRNQT